MVSPNRAVHFDRTHFDDVVLAVIVLDSFTGQVITDGIRIHLEKQIGANVRRFPIKPVRNASGMQIYLNRRNQAPFGSPPPIPLPPFQLIIEARDAGYFDPLPIPVNALPNDRRLVLSLHRSPGIPLDAGTTSVDGVVVIGPARVENALIRAVFPPVALPPNANPQPFETRTDKRGAFSLRLRLPGAIVNTRLEVSRNGPPLIFNRNLTEGVAYAFDGLIDLQPNAPNNNPPLVEMVP